MKFNPIKTFSFLYLPFLWIAVISTLVYSALNYFVLQYISFIGETTANLVVPGALVSLAYIFFYKQKLKVAPKFRADMFRSFILVIFLSVPGPVILQFAVEDLSIRSHVNARYEDISETSGVHQYQLAQPLQFRIGYNVGTSGLYPRYYRSYNKNAPDDSHHEVFMVALVNSPTNQKPLFWFGKKYDTVVRKDRTSDARRDELYQATIRNGVVQFSELSKADSITLLELNVRNDDYQYFRQAIANSEDSVNANLPLVTEIPRRKPIDTTIKAALIAFVIGQVIWAIFCLFIRVQPGSIDKDERLSSSQRLRTQRKEFLESISWFVPRKGYVATPIILDINIAVFVILGFLGVSMGSPSGSDLIPYGSNYTPAVMNGEVWRLITAGFLHFGFVHILMNMVVLVMAGYMLEHVLGTTRFTILYMVSLLGCSLTGLYWHHPGNLAGASGAIFGLMGAMLLYGAFKIGEESNRAVFLIIFTFFGLFTLITDMIAWSHSDMAGHLGGMFTGMLVAILFIPKVRKAKEVEM